MARVYADVNQNMPRSYWDYDSVNISEYNASSPVLLEPKLSPRRRHGLGESIVHYVIQRDDTDQCII
jgi:hypothetical protein